MAARNTAADETNELDHILAADTVIKSRRMTDTTALVWVETNNGPAPHAVEIAADHGIEAKEIKRTPTAALYRVVV